MANTRGKSFKALAVDIAEGYLAVNPILLKPLDGESLKELYQEVNKHQVEIRSGKFPTGDVQGIRMRNLKLQRLFSAAMVIRNFAKAKKIILI